MTFKHRSSVKQSISHFRQSVDEFDYGQMRKNSIVISFPNENSVIHHFASESAMKHFYEIFVDTLATSPEKKVRQYFSRLESHGKEEQKNIIALADILKQFHKNIQKSEYAYAKKINKDLSTYEISNDGNWISFFHFVFQQHGKRIPNFSEKNYGLALKNIKSLSRGCYRWLNRNLPNKLNDYSILQSKEDKFNFVTTSPLLFSSRKTARPEDEKSLPPRKKQRTLGDTDSASELAQQSSQESTEEKVDRRQIVRNKLF